MNKNTLWVTIGDGVVGVAESGRNGFPLMKPRGFPMPESLSLDAALVGHAEELADFIAGCLLKTGSSRKKLSLLLGTGVSFYEEYQVNPRSGKLREDQRGLALDKVIEDDLSSYIIEDIAEVTNEDDTPAEATNKNDAPVAGAGGAQTRLITRAVCGTKYDFLAGLVKALRKRGYRVEFAVSAQAVARRPAGKSAKFSDFTCGGRENRRFGRMTTVLCICAVIVAVAMAMLQPIEAWKAEADAQERWNAIVNGADAQQYERLYAYRQTQAYLPYYRNFTAALDATKTAYGDLLTSLRAGVLRNAVIEELALGEDDGILVSFTVKDAVAFENELELLNESRKMSAAEVGKRESIGKGKDQTWRIQIKVSYYTFEKSGVAG
ncbi:MAG: hypothetical protein LBT52_00440 [Clostridiales Family XIII bacterium]|jgi:hypothetical protein|nr:hypothetical protein [Clostridiales Family XIII bacterium]